MHVAGDADDSAPWAPVMRACANALANRVVAREKLFRERFIHEDDGRSGLVVVIGERTAAQHGNLHRLEIAGAHRIAMRGRIVFRTLARMALTVDSIRIEVTRQWELTGE